MASNRAPKGVALYGKIFDSIFESSIMEADLTTRYLWHCLIVIADQHGNVDMTPEALARRVNLPLDSVKQSLETLASPDPASRSPEADGRRIVKLDEHRDWGWHLVNHEKYRKIRTPFDRRTYMREYMRHKRSKAVSQEGVGKTAVKPRKQRLAALASAEAEADTDIKKEKRRKTCRPPIPDELASVPGFAAAWERRITALPSSKRPTPDGEELQLREMGVVLSTGGPRAVISAVEEAINRRWTGFKASWVERAVQQPGRLAANAGRTAGFNAADLRGNSAAFDPES